MSFGHYPCENCGNATLNTTYCSDCNHTHIFVPWCVACGKPAYQGLCHSCGDLGQAPKACEICGEYESELENQWEKRLKADLKDWATHVRQLFAR